MSQPLTNKDLADAFQMDMEGFVETGMAGDAWDFDQHPLLRGVYLRKKAGIGDNNSNMYYVENQEDHKVYGVWGSTVIDARFDEIMIGEEVVIKYEGKVKSQKSGRTFKSFRILHKPLT